MSTTFTLIVLAYKLRTRHSPLSKSMNLYIYGFLAQERYYFERLND